MAATQKHRFLAIGTALGADKLLIEKLALTDSLGRLFQMEVELASEDPAIAFDDIVGTNATVRLELPDKKTRYFNGYVARFAQTAQEHRFARYRATLVPWLWFLTRTADCRIFQKMKVPDIIEKVFKDHGFKDYKLSLSGVYREWEYCVQYRESDFSFVSRLMEQEGIYYYFEHADGTHTLVLADSPSAHSPFAGYDTLVYRPRTHQGEETAEAVTDWIIESEVQTGVYALADFDFKNPAAPIVTNANVSRAHAASSFEVYDYPGVFEKRLEGETYAKVRIQELQAQHQILRGQATARGIATGAKFKLKSHPRDDQNRDHLVTGLSLEAGVGAYESAAPAQGRVFFTCSFSAMPASEPFRSPRLTPKPLIQGPQTAVVVGKKGEEIDTDEFGRVKVQFHWDRYGKVDENSSCWVRVSQPWAGKGWGAISIPRVGQEVVVEFLDGNPDRPIITGRVYNAKATVPYPLPDRKTVSTLKTNSSKGGGGANEVRFEDKKGSEQLFIHAEKDQDLRVKNDAKEWIGNDRHRVVKKDQLDKVEGDKHSGVKGNRLSKTEGDQGDTVKGDRHVAVDGVDHLEAKGDQCVKVGGDAGFKAGKNLNQEAGMKLSVKSGLDFHAKAGMNYALDAGMNVHIKGGMVVVIEAGVQLSLKAGANFIDIGPAGVAISGTPMVMINSGGAAGAGAGSTPTAPAAPEAPDPPKEPKVAEEAKPGAADGAPAAGQPPERFSYSASAKVLKAAAADGTPFCEKCEAAKKK
jgi:type VI secretion system secreted protein VgrG